MEEKKAVAFPPNPYRLALKRGLICSGLFFCAAIFWAIGSNKEIWEYTFFSVGVPSDGKNFSLKGVLWVALSGFAGIFSLLCLAPMYWVRRQAKAVEQLVEDLRKEEPLARFSIKGEDWYENNKPIVVRYVLMVWAVVLGATCLSVGGSFFLDWEREKRLSFGMMFEEHLPVMFLFVSAGILGTLYFLYPFYRMSRREHEVILYPGVMLLGPRWVIWRLRDIFRMVLVEVVSIQKENPRRYAIRLTLESRRSTRTRKVWEDRIHFCIPIPEEQKKKVERLEKMFRTGKL